MNIDELLFYFKNLKLSGTKREIAKGVIKEIIDRLEFLSNVGLNYLKSENESSLTQEILNSDSKASYKGFLKKDIALTMVISWVLVATFLIYLVLGIISFLFEGSIP